MNENRKQLWDKAIEEIDDKYIEETAKTIIKKSGKPVALTEITVEQSENEKDSRFRRALPVALSSAAALAVVIGAGYLIKTYDISMSSSLDGEKQTTTDVSHTTTGLEIDDDGNIIVVEPDDPDDNEPADYYGVKVVNFDSYSVDLLYEHGGEPMENMVIKCRELSGAEYTCEFETGIPATSINTRNLQLYGYELMSGDILALWTQWNEGQYVVYLYECSPEKIKPVKTNIGEDYEEVFALPSISADPAYDYLYIYDNGGAKQAYSVKFGERTYLSAAELFEMDKNTEYIDISDEDFVIPVEDMPYPFAGNWTPAFANKANREYNLNWNFDNVAYVAETEDYWYFKKQSSTPDENIYVMPKDNDKYIYQYYYNGVSFIQFCDYMKVLERNDSAPVTDKNKIERFYTEGETVYNLKLNYGNDGSEAMLYLSRNDGTGEETSIYTGIFPKDTGNITPELYIITTANGRVVVVDEPYEKDEGITHRNHLFTVSDGRIYRFTYPNSSPADIESNNGIGALWGADLLYTNIIHGEPRTYYSIDYDERIIRMLDGYFDIDKNTEPINCSSKKFDPITSQAVNRAYEDKWEVVFGGSWTSEGFEFDFSKAEQEFEDEKAWYFYNVLNGPTDDDGPVLYVIFKDSPQFMYAYHDTSETNDILFCNYSYIFKRVDEEPTDISTTTIHLEDCIVGMHSKNSETIKLIVRSNITNELLTEYDTGLKANKVGKTETVFKTTEFKEYMLGTLFIPEITENGVMYRNYFYHIKENEITPFTTATGHSYSTLTESYERDVYYTNNSVWYAELGTSLGDDKTYYCFDFEKSFTYPKNFFLIDTDKSLINFKELEFTLAENEEDTPFYGRWEFPYETMSDAPLIINTDCTVAETNKAWYSHKISGGEGVLYCIMKDNPDYLYIYGWHIDEKCAHSDYSLVYKRSEISVGEEYVRGFLQMSVLQLNYISDLTIKLTGFQHIMNNEVISEFPLDYEYEMTSDGKPYFETFEGFADGQIGVLYIPDGNGQFDVHLYNVDGYKIEEITAYNREGEPVQLKAWYNTLRNIELDSNSFATSWCEIGDDSLLMYTETFERYEIDFENSTAKQIDFYPLDSDTSKMRTDFTPAENTVEIIEEVLYGEWMLKYDCFDDDDANPGSHMTLYNMLEFSYYGECGDYPNNCLTQVICEDEKGWYCTGQNGTYEIILYIPKDDPDTLYYYHASKNLLMNQYKYVYERYTKVSSAAEKITAPANLSALGVSKIKESIGYDIFDTPEILTDAQGGKWSTAEVYNCGTGDIYLTALSDNSITYCIRAYPEDKEMISYNDEHVFPVVDYSSFAYLTVTAKKTGGKWKITEVMNKYGLELYELVYSLQKEYNGIYEAVIDYIIPNYLKDEFWDESINPEKTRITAEAIINLQDDFHEENDTQMVDIMLSDKSLIYAMCQNSYWNE